MLSTFSRSRSVRSRRKPLRYAASTTGAGIGAYVGFVLTGPAPTALLLISVPAGMIICGAAKGIADALENGLRDRLLRFLRGKAAP
jgi:hypothetical protein